jgi:hypothetical protein
VHTNISLRFLLAAIDTWDGSFSAEGAPIPDYFNVTVDGTTIFFHTLENYNPGGSQTYVPPEGVLLTPPPFRELGFTFRGDPPDFGDTAYDLGADPTFLIIPHTASTLTVSWFTSGAGWQGGDDESWAIDNVSVSTDTDPREDLRARIAVSCVDICWPGRTNKTYQVQDQSDLAPHAWLNLGAPVSGNGTNCVTDPVGGRARRFYRIQEVQ